MWHKILVASLIAQMGLAWGEVDVNHAEIAALDRIHGIGPSMSRRILHEREHAKFKNWTDFMVRIPGIKEKTAAKFSAQGLTVNGKSFPE